VARVQVQHVCGAELNPFFVYLPFTQIHPPLGHHPEFNNATGTGIYDDIIAELDYNIGRVLDALADAGLADDTIVMLTGDNGTATEGLGGSNGPFRGGFTGYEAGLRAVGITRWPGKIEEGRVSGEIVAALDIMPTLASLIGEADGVPRKRPIDGVDQSAFVLGDQENSAREHILCYIGEELIAVKWRSFKVHLKTVEDLWAPVQTHLFPPIYDDHSH
jgi:arylsulfatase A-like enzyme